MSRNNSNELHHLVKSLQILLFCFLSQQFWMNGELANSPRSRDPRPTNPFCRCLINHSVSLKSFYVYLNNKLVSKLEHNALKYVPPTELFSKYKGKKNIPSRIVKFKKMWIGRNNVGKKASFFTAMALLDQWKLIKAPQGIMRLIPLWLECVV